MKKAPYRIFLSPPHLSGFEEAALQEVMKSNWLAPVGPALDTFESDLCALTGANHAIALQSGSAALHLSMVLLGVTQGDEVIVSSFTHNATVNCILYQGATPIFIDSCPKTWNLDIDILETVLEAKRNENKLPKAIIIVHLYGNPLDMKRVMALSKRFGVPVVEDAAEALGSTLNGKALGTFGDLGVLSFNGNKIITTTGGGALLTQDAEMAKRALFLATQARDAAPYFQHSTLGYNYRLSNLLAAFGSAQLKLFAAFLKKRQSNFEYYRAFFDRLGNELGLPVASHQELLPTATSNHWLSSFVFREGRIAESIISKLESQGIEARYTWKPMHLQPIFEKYPFFGTHVSDALFSNGVCFPSGYDLTEDDLLEICNLVAEVIREAY